MDGLNNTGIQHLKSLGSGYKHAGMTLFKRLYIFKSESC